MENSNKYKNIINVDWLVEDLKTTKYQYVAMSTEMEVMGILTPEIMKTVLEL